VTQNMYQNRKAKTR